MKYIGPGKKRSNQKCVAAEAFATPRGGGSKESYCASGIRIHDTFSLFVDTMTYWGVPKGEFEINMAPKGRVILVYWKVRTGRFFLGMFKAMVFAAAEYRVICR